jgi:hypothetical protein
MRLSRYLFLLIVVVVGFCTNLAAAKEYKYSYLPKKVYENQLFPITIIEIESNSKATKFIFDKSSKNQPIFKTPLVIQNGNDKFYTFYFKADKKTFHLPSLKIRSDNDEMILNGSDIPIMQLKPRDDFSGVLAADMKVKTSQASTYDGENNLVTISIEAYEANIEDMYLNIIVKEDGIENIKRKNAKVIAEYYAVVPSTQKNLKFTYFNTIKGQYLFLNVPIVIKSYSVSTQSEINPKNDSFDKLKKYAFIGFAIFFLLMFLWKRDFFYLILTALTLITLLTFYRPKEKICVEQGAPLYILPTDTSRISNKIDKELNTVLLGKRLEFNKIEYKNQTVGWIKDENLCKD